MKKFVLIVHPKDHTTGFLSKIKNYLKSIFPDITHHFNIQFNEKSHNDCLEKISSHNSEGLILFLGHGRSEKLFGSISKLYLEEVSDEAKADSPEIYFGKETFIDFSNIQIFQNKKIICLSCNSRGKIGLEAVKKGAKVFFGFGNLPLSVQELKEEGEQNTPGSSLFNVERHLKKEITYIVKKTLELGLKNNYTFLQLLNLMQFITSQIISEYLVDKKAIRERKIIVGYLYNFKKEITVYGDYNQKLLGE